MKKWPLERKEKKFKGNIKWGKEKGEICLKNGVKGLKTASFWVIKSKLFPGREEGRKDRVHNIYPSKTPKHSSMSSRSTGPIYDFFFFQQN